MIPLTEGQYTMPLSPSEKPLLIGSKCTSCGELYFPKKEKGFCVHCQQKTLEDVELNGKGKISSFTVVMIPAAGGFYHGPVPYAYGFVDLQDGVRVETHFTGNFDELKVGKDVELVIEKLYKDDKDNEYVTYKFKPI